MNIDDYIIDLKHSDDGSIVSAALPQDSFLSFSLVRIPTRVILAATPTAAAAIIVDAGSGNHIWMDNYEISAHPSSFSIKVKLSVVILLYTKFILSYGRSLYYAPSKTLSPSPVNRIGGGSHMCGGGATVETTSI